MLRATHPDIEYHLGEGRRREAYIFGNRLGLVALTEESITQGDGAVVGHGVYRGLVGGVGGGGEGQFVGMTKGPDVALKTG